MKTALKAFEQELDAIREAGTWREERIIKINRNHLAAKIDEFLAAN